MFFLSNQDVEDGKTVLPQGGTKGKSANDPDSIMMPGTHYSLLTIHHWVLTIGSDEFMEALVRLSIYIVKDDVATTEKLLYVIDK